MDSKDGKKDEEIALFRYGLIAGALHMSRAERRKYFTGLTEKEFTVPHYGLKKYRVNTFKDWLKDYQNGGLTNLMPATRSDTGVSKKITQRIIDLVKKMIADFPYLSVAGIYRMLVHEGHIRDYDFGENTLRHFINKNKLREEGSKAGPGRKKFEKDNVNELWVSDFMKGPYLLAGHKKKQVTLCAILDDHSRIITGWGWFVNENCLALAQTLKTAVCIYGIPDTFYCDNGKVFSTNYLHLICARLGIALVHSKPYDSPSRGKIERFFRTVRDKFLAALDLTGLKSVETLNELFAKWLDEEYHKILHAGIEERPLDRYLKSAQRMKIRTITKHEAESFFITAITRNVKKDATVSVNSKLYEVPVEFIGKKLVLCFPIDDPDKISIYENDKPVCLIRPVNLSENATKPYTGIHFRKLTETKKENEEDQTK